MTGGVFEGFEDLEMFSIFADGEVERGTGVVAIVEDEEDASVAEADGVDAGVGVGQCEQAGLGPCATVVE